MQTYKTLLCLTTLVFPIDMHIFKWLQAPISGRATTVPLCRLEGIKTSPRQQETVGFLQFVRQRHPKVSTEANIVDARKEKLCQAQLPSPS